MTRWRLRAGALAVATLMAAGANARALTLENLNLVHLLRQSESIVIGNVQTATDGIDESGLPYTEVTLGIDESLRGEQPGTYVFRQFGLMTPRLTPDGTKVMLAAPEGIPRYAEGE